MLFHALRAGINERDFWQMTVHSVIMAFSAANQNMSRLAYRIAYYQRVSGKHFPKKEELIFSDGKPKKRQSLADQFASARLITSIMSKEIH